MNRPAPAAKRPCSTAACCALLALAAFVASLAGCAAGGWLEQPLEDAELPIEQPAHRYPTALHGQLGEDLARASPPPVATTPPPAAANSDSPAAQQAAAAQTPIQPAAGDQAAKSPRSQRIDRSQPFLTPLAVVPPQFAHRTMQPATTVATEPTHSQPATAAANSEGVPLAMTAAIGAELHAPLATPFISGLGAAPAAVEPRTAAVLHETSAIPAATTTVARAAHETPSDTGTGEPGAPADRLEQAQRAWIDALEEDIRRRRSENATDEELPRLEQQLRLAYLAAGRFDDAVAAVASLDAPQSEAYKHLMFGLGVWLSPDEARRQSLRSAKVLHSLREATSELAAASKLEVRKIAFCERVDYFGWYTEFPRTEFRPRQEVILYAEIENFSADQKGPAAFETELQGSYEILDSAGQAVASRHLQLDKETCRNLRRDYYLAYKIYMPENVSPGRYRLELTVEDLKARGKYQGRKLGEGVVEFSIK